VDVKLRASSARTQQSLGISRVFFDKSDEVGGSDKRYSIEILRQTGEDL
jgi:hypothetical protein